MPTEPPRAEAIKGAHQPFVPPEAKVKEFTARAVILGSILGILFAASSTYLGLKVGLTVSASIPIAVLAITVFRWLRMRATILENNIVQTTGSAGESIAAGVAFTLPSLLIMGFQLELIRVLLVGLLGGLIGVLMMIPLRHGLIVKEHGKLIYPEGTACADVLIVGEKGGTQAATVFTGFFVGLGYAALNVILELWKPVATFALDMGGRLKQAKVDFEVSPPMLGVGYIIGPRVSANMMAGGMLAFVVLIPLIAQFGGAEVAGKDADKLRNDYILYIGAGAVAAGGFIALARSIPTIIGAFRRGLQNIGGGKAQASVPRTERDLPMTVVLGGSGILAVAIFAAPVLDIDFLTALLVVLFGFFFVTVSSRITGEIGSSSNPISGMTIATLLLTCGLFVLLGRTGIGFKAMALTTAALVCVAASNGGTISQDLKTGFLVGATPRHQQVTILIGVVTSAIVIGFTLLLLDKSVTTYQAVRYDGFKAPANTVGVVQTSDRENGPDGNSYRVTYIQTNELATADGTPIPRGKYYVDDAGEMMFFVHPGVVGTYPYKLEKFTGSFPPLAVGYDDTLYVPDDKAPRVGKDLGFVAAPDSCNKQLLKGFTLSTKVGDDEAALAPGRYLIAPGGAVKYREDGGKLVAWAGTAPKHLARAPDGSLFVSREDDIVGTDHATDLGLDRKPYHASDLTEVVKDLRPGRYLVDEKSDQIAYYSKNVIKYNAPKAAMFALIIDGTLGSKLPWGLVLIGVFIAILLELVGVKSLPFAVGLYLPISTSAAIFVGGGVRWIVDRKRKGESAAAAEFSPGMLMASGLIAGGAILSVIQSIMLVTTGKGAFGFDRFLPDVLATNDGIYPMFMFLVMAGALYWIGTTTKNGGDGNTSSAGAKKPKKK